LPTQDTPRGYTIVPSSTPLIRGANVEEPIVLESGGFQNVSISDALGTTLIYVYLNDPNSPDTVFIFDWDGVSRGEIDLNIIVPAGEMHFTVGPDGYLYVIDPANNNIYVLDPLGEIVSVVQLEGLPVSGWELVVNTGGTTGMPLAAPSTRAFIDWEGRLIVYDTENSAISFYALREGNLDDVE
jgi:hypothetical protein